MIILLRDNWSKHILEEIDNTSICSFSSFLNEGLSREDEKGIRKKPSYAKVLREKKRII